MRPGTLRERRPTVTEGKERDNVMDFMADQEEDFERSATIIEKPSDPSSMA